MINIIGLSKAFGNNVVLDDVSLQVSEGLTTALFGPSGTGKSVLIKHIIGLIEPDAGDVIVDGVSIPNANIRQLNQVRQRCSAAERRVEKGINGMAVRSLG